ncbi:MAG: UDP-N-acetylmuramoyl-L-alanine--D-glutamate ligase, partial [Synergistales bacterium]|nr:UDP-N-acetylmuramoyl-L-alanine--D-glutamate ligase [Synergistales bacterium]
MKHTGMTARITNRTVTVIGAGVSGRSLTRFLVNHGAHVFVSDRNALSSEVCRELETLGVEWEEGHSHRALEADFLVLSSGIPPSAPLVKEAANAAVPVVGEVDVLSPYLRGAVIGVTGSNGKSTTTAIAGHLLRQAGYRTAVAGNIGTPLADIADDQWDYVIAELSSFQLHWARSLSLSGAVLTNIAPDHIDWHGTFEQYAATKRKINDFVLPGGFLVCPQQELPYMQRDDVKIVSLGDKGSCPDAGGNVLSSTETSWLLRLDGEWHRLFSGADVPLAGSHNEENVAMAGACAACLIGPRDVGPLLQGFQGLAHRCQ